MRVTNADRADLIDALQLAAEQLRFWSPVKGKRCAYRPEWRAQIRRYTALRKRLLAEEQATKGCEP